MKTKKVSRVLVIPGGFVPINDTVTLLCYKHLRLIDAEFDVVALRGVVDNGIRKNLENDLNFSKFNIEYFCDYDDAIATLERKNVISGVINSIRYCLYARKKAKMNDYEFVYTSSIPAITHFAGYLIKRLKRDKIKWVASLSDPLNKSPYKYDEESIKEYSFIEKIGFFVYTWIYMNGFYEKLCQKYADKIIYICEEQRDFSLQFVKNRKEIEKKSIIVPLNYIKEWDIYRKLINVDKHERNEPLVLSHFGRIYGLRKIDKFIFAIKELKDENPNLSQKFIIRQYGQIIQRYSKMIEEYNLTDCFQIIDKLPYNQAMAEMEKSDVLILFDTIMDDNRIQPYLPSKSLEYLLLKKPLFILTTKLSPSNRIFSKFGYKVTMNKKDEIKKDVLDCINNIPNGVYDIKELENENSLKELTIYFEKKGE